MRKLADTPISLRLTGAIWLMLLFAWGVMIVWETLKISNFLKPVSDILTAASIKQGLLCLGGKLIEKKSL